MVKIKSLISLLLFAICFTAHTQIYKVGGIVTDSIGTPEPFVTARIFRLPDSINPIAVLATEDNGKFSRQLSGPGKSR